MGRLKFLPKIFALPTNLQGKDPYEAAETQQRLLGELRKFEALVDKFSSDRTALDSLWKEMNAKAEEKDPRFKTAISVARDEHISVLTIMTY